MTRHALVALIISALVVAAPLAQKNAPAKPGGNAKLDALKQEAVADVESRTQFAQQMVDQTSSYAELGFQEFETNGNWIDILKKNGFGCRKASPTFPPR